MLTLLFAAVATAASLPGLTLPFEDKDGGWVLADGLAPELVEGGLAPGWRLTAVDDLEFTNPLAVKRAVAQGPSRDVRLRFSIPGARRGQDETIIVARRSALVHAEQVDLLPWPSGFQGATQLWRSDGSGWPAAIDGTGQVWVVDPDAGEIRPATDPGDPIALTSLFWELSTATWAILRPDAVDWSTRDAAQGDLGRAARVSEWYGAVGDHLLLQTAAGLEVLAIDHPRGTPQLPSCSPRVPETCLASGKQILAQLADRPGAAEEARAQFGIACTQGVHRACFEAVALDAPDLQSKVSACVDHAQIGACTAVAEDRYSLDPNNPDEVVLGMLDFACQLEGSGTLGQRLRRLEDVGEACLLLSEAHDARGAPDQALLALDQGCVLGRAEACEDAESRRHEAYAARTVRECEDPDRPIAPSCVELGQLLQQGPIPSATLDDFGAFLRGCSLGSTESCMRLGDYVDRWGIDNIRVKQAESDLGRSCSDGEQRACLGQAHLLVRHEPRSEAYGQALTLFSGACRDGLGEACIAGAEQRRIGAARKLAAPPQLEMWGQACALNEPLGCAGHGAKLARVKTSLEIAFGSWTRACDLGNAHSCSELGKLVERSHDPMWSGEQPTDRYLRRGCESGDPEGCFWLAEHTLPKKGEPDEDTYLLLEQSCEGEHGAGCAALADVHLDRGTSFDEEIAARHLETACGNGSYDSCRVLGVMYMSGKGVERDRRKAKELLERFRVNASRRLIRLGLQAGLPSVVSGELEAVLPIPVGPAISFSGTYTNLPGLGRVLVLLDGDDAPKQAPGLQVISASGRVYPNHQARGLYGALGWTHLKAAGGTLEDERVRNGWSARMGLRTDVNFIYTGVELGIGQYGVLRLRDFDKDSKGAFPVILPTFAFNIGVAFL
ncbi:MAG: TPR repeat protein [Myxococcota bacterium]|jgi:TPR repeat protein